MQAHRHDYVTNSSTFLTCFFYTQAHRHDCLTNPSTFLTYALMSVRPAFKDFFAWVDPKFKEWDEQVLQEMRSQATDASIGKDYYHYYCVYILVLILLCVHVYLLYLLMYVHRQRQLRASTHCSLLRRGANRCYGPRGLRLQAQPTTPPESRRASLTSHISLCLRQPLSLSHTSSSSFFLTSASCLATFSSVSRPPLSCYAWASMFARARERVW
jgi:hypothetical protein